MPCFHGDAVVVARVVLSHMPCCSNGDHVGSSSGLSCRTAHHPAALYSSPLSPVRNTSHHHPPADMGVTGDEHQERALLLPRTALCRSHSHSSVGNCA